MDNSTPEHAPQPAQPINKLESLNLLRWRVARAPHDGAAWYLLSRASDDPDEIRNCLDRLLLLNMAGKSFAAAPAEAAVVEEPWVESPAAIAPAASAPAKAARPLPWEWKAVGYALTAVLVCVLAGVFVPMLMGDRALVILSGSMVPAIQTGAVVIVQPVPADTLQIGDVIAYSPGGTTKIPRVHRILSIRQAEGVNYYTTQGDANASPDADEFTVSGSAWRLRYSIPWVGYGVTFASSRTGMILLIVVPLIGLAAPSLKPWLQRPMLWGARQMSAIKMPQLPLAEPKRRSLLTSVKAKTTLGRLDAFLDTVVAETNRLAARGEKFLKGLRQGIGA